MSDRRPEGCAHCHEMIAAVEAFAKAGVHLCQGIRISERRQFWFVADHRGMGCGDHSDEAEHATAIDALMWWWREVKR